MNNDLAIIERIEKKLKVELDPLPLDKIFGQSDYTKGYALDPRNGVTGLALDNLPAGPVIGDIRLLKNLSKISLFSCSLQEASFLQELKGLTSLNLGGNEKIKDYSFLKELKGLTSLDLSYNNLTGVSFLKELQGLTYLDLYNNNLTGVSFLKELKGLTSLDLGFNNLDDASFLKELKGLTSLNLAVNNLTSVSFLKELKGLTSLNLGGNEKIKDYSFLKELRGLTSLNLYNNNLIDVSFLKDMDNLTWVKLDENPVKNPPPEIVAQGLAAIRNYLKSFDVSARKKLNEVKVLLVGDGGAGKTSLVKQLQGKPFDKNESATHGINIITLDIAAAAANGSAENIKAHLWDFGGQEIMHASHQFFLSKRSLYILVLDSRKDDKTEYWLKHIESFGGDSPVLIVINKTDQNHAFDVDRKSLLRKYKNIKGFYRISCQSGEGIAAFEKALKKEIPGVELLRTEVAESWLQVKEKLEKVTSEHNYISDGTFIDICREQGITEESVRETLIEFLNELGIVLHFKRLTLNDFHVLNPCWVTEAVYKIINSPYLAQNNGILAEKKLGFVLNEETAKNEPLDLSLNIPYQGREQGYILSLMQEFELCYTYGRGKILIPDLLPHYEPAFKPPDKKPLEFLIRYDFLPKSIMPRFIVKSHGDIEGELRWRTGVVLANKDFKTRALVRADEEDKTIYIRISGTRRRDHLTVIRHTFREINERFENLDYKELITLPIPAKVSEKFGGEEKVPAEYRRTVSYRFLLGYEAGGKANYFEGETGVSYPVAELLDSVVGKEERLIEMGVGSAGTGRDKDRLEDDIREKYEIKLQKKDEEHRAAAKKMAELKARIKKEKKLKGVCDKLAEKKARKSVWRFVFINLFVLAAWLAALILIDWEKMGRFAILTAPLAAVFHMAYYAIFGKKFNSEESKKRRLEDEKETQYALHRFSEEDYQALQKQLEALEHPI